MKTKRIILSLLALGMLLGLVGCSSAKENEPVVDNTVEQETDEQQQARFEERYQEAIALESSKPDAAIRMFESLNDYKDSKERVSDYKFNEGMELFDKGSYSIGLVKILQSEKYAKDSDFISDIYETIGDDAWEKGKTEYALRMYENMNTDTKYEARKAEAESNK